MDAFDNPLNMSEYFAQFFKQCDQPLNTVQDGDIAAPDLAVPAAGDSPQGPLTDVGMWDTGAAPSAAQAVIKNEIYRENGPVGADTDMYLYDLNTDVPTIAPAVVQQPINTAPLPTPPPPSPPQQAPRTQRASAARAGALWNENYIAEAEKSEDDAANVASASTSLGAKLKKSDAAFGMKNQIFQKKGTVSKLKLSKKSAKSAGDNDDDDYIGSYVAPKKRLLVPPAPRERETRRERQKPSIYRAADMLDTDEALLGYERDEAAGMAAMVLEQEAELSKNNGIEEVLFQKEEDDEEEKVVVVVGSAEKMKSKRIAAREELERQLSPWPPPAKKAKKSAASTKQKTSPAKKKQQQKEQQRSTTLTPPPPTDNPIPSPPPYSSPTPAPPPPAPQDHPLASASYKQPSAPPETLTKDDILLGCNKCRYTKTGCGSCRDRPPAFTRPPTRWNPFQGHHQLDIPAAPSFRPTKEEFKDPVAYITKIMPEATKYGLAHIIPPEGWDPPFALEKGTNGVSMESFKFAIRKQLTSHLCYRSAPLKPPAAAAAAAAAEDGTVGGEEGAPVNEDVAANESRYGKKKKILATTPPEATITARPPPTAAVAVDVDAKTEEAAVVEEEQKQAEESPAAPAPVLTADDILAALAAANSGQESVDLGATQSQEGEDEGEQKEKENEDEDDVDDNEKGCIIISGEQETVPMNDFGFVPLEKKQTLRSFAAYADWVKAVHFSDPPPLGYGTSSAPQRRPLKVLPLQHSAPVEPSVEEIEAEFWRIVETPDTYLESLYGQDLDSGHHGSGFPLPEWRRRLLEAHLALTKNNKTTNNSNATDTNNNKSPATGAINTTNAASTPTKTSTTKTTTVELPAPSTEAEKFYSEHPWNINNMPRSKSSMLRYLLGDGLITGVMVPWLYVGSCLSAFCWHVEDHALYSVNYLHMGAPKVWYGVPADATLALEEAMQDALPHLFESNPGLLHQLVTTLSPMELKKRGVPVYRVVHEAGSFIVTMPDAYHSGFNTGFNCAEAVNFAAPGWIPFGTDISQKYRDAERPVTMSHDSLLVALATAAQHVMPTKKKEMEKEDDTTTIIGGTEGLKEHGKALISPDEKDTTTTTNTTASLAAAPSAPPPGNNTVQKQAVNGFGPLGDIPWADAPLDGITLGTGELALRAAEEKQRWATGAQALISLGSAVGPTVNNSNDNDVYHVKGKEGKEGGEGNSHHSNTIGDTSLAAAISPTTTSASCSTSLLDVLPCRTMNPCTSNPGSKDPVTGVYEDTAECDCAECQGDLWLAAVVSSSAPDVAVCPEHAAALVHKHNCPLNSLVLLCRYSPSDLQQLVDVAVERIEGAEEAVVAAHERRSKLEEGRVRAIPLGPLYPTNEHGECTGVAGDAVMVGCGAGGCAQEVEVKMRKKA